MDKKDSNKNNISSEEKTELPNEPVCMTLAKAQNDITMAVVQIQNMYGLPSYLMDLIVSSTLVDIRACSNKELLNSFNVDRK